MRDSDGEEFAIHIGRTALSGLTVSLPQSHPKETLRNQVEGTHSAQSPLQVTLSDLEAVVRKHTRRNTNTPSNFPPAVVALASYELPFRRKPDQDLW